MCPCGVPHTHRFSGSELKGSALINKRLMTEPPGKDPDIPARTPMRETTGGHSPGQEPLNGEKLVSLRLAGTFLRTRYMSLKQCRSVYILTINSLGSKITILNLYS